MARTLSRQEAKAFYDRLGARQDWQGFYENPALADLVSHASFDAARSLCEFGCGTGRFAAALLARRLGPDCRYLGLDLSTTMVRLTRARLAPWEARAGVLQSDGSPGVPAADGSFDRFVATYLLDLLSETDIRGLLAEAHRVLAPGGLLCLVALTKGRTALPRLVTTTWRWIFRRRPSLLGGCRPIELDSYLSSDRWRVRHQAVIASFGISSEVVVALRR